MARNWYSYNGIGDPLLNTSYIQAFVKPSCINGSTVCAIYAPGLSTPTAPLSTRLRNYIANVLLAFIPQPDSNLAFKKYVYAKNANV